MSVQEREFEFFKTGVSEMQEYLLSDNLFWRLGGPVESFPDLSLGSLLLARKRLEGFADQFPGLPGLDIQLDSIHARWQAAWESKASREIANRLNLWRRYLDDLKENPESAAEQYVHDVRMRVILQLLDAELHDLSIAGTLDHLDASLRLHWLPGKFIWDAPMYSSFPEGDYWYLYGSIKI
jgi:hypothetical protein